MPKSVQIIDGVEYTVEEYGSVKICSVRKDDLRIERTYCGRFLQFEEIHIGQRLEIRYYRFGKLHRERGPAIYVVDDNFTGEYWFRGGQRHRIDGPAIEETRNGIRYESYYKDGLKIELKRVGEKSQKPNG